MLLRNTVQVFLLSFFTIYIHCCYSFTYLNPKTRPALTSIQSSKQNEEFSRRDFATWTIGTIGAVAYGKLAASAMKQIYRGDGVYPEDHEKMVSSIFQRAVTESGNNIPFGQVMRILEVGIGPDCRTIKRGLYNNAFRDYHRDIHFFGIDIDPPSLNSIDQAREEVNKSYPFVTKFNIQKGDIVQGLPFSNGFFDVVTCSLVLCSVSDQIKSLEEVKRILKPGGTFGFVEHVRVDLENLSEKNKLLLEWQQRALDPLQQAVAHNCHLHRDTDRVIRSIFSDANILQSERFFIKDMWPISCQCSGVIKTNL